MFVSLHVFESPVKLCPFSPGYANFMPPPSMMFIFVACASSMRTAPPWGLARFRALRALPLLQFGLLVVSSGSVEVVCWQVTIAVASSY